ncbi:hypothetical protein JXO59_13580 [candidate division KSB1 bacterium]|nr:hypothetical protein [candidate division KSB1 bacterium]
MFSRIIKHQWLMVSILLAGLFFTLEAQTIKQRDVEIMETILDRLILGDERTPFTDEKTRGTVLDGYGVIFYVPYASPHISVWSTGESDSTKGEKGFRQSYRYRYKDGNVEAKADRNAQIVKIKQALTTFFADYAGALRLPATNRMTVVVELDGNRIYSVAKQTQEWSNAIHASMRGDQLAAARKGTLSLDALEKAIIFSGDQNEVSEYEDISIMAKVFDSAMRGDDKRFLALRGKTRGMYFPGFGAVFMTAPSHAANILLTTFSHGFARTSERAVLLDELDEVKEDDVEKEQQARMKKMKEEYIGLIAQYGSTLKTPKNDEYLFILIETGLPGLKGSGSRMSLRAKMSDIRAVAQERISLDAFKSKVNVWQ